jgi:acyl-coenzyme A thioesterase PaaI-like protein
MKWALNLYPPYLGAGIRIRNISRNWRDMHVSMTLRWYNRNAVGTHFGGSLYAMTDPHLMLMLMQILGRDYIVWDYAASIVFLKPGKGKVNAHFHIPEERIKHIIDATEDGSKHTPEFTVFITDQQGRNIAEIKKTLYVRRKAT